LRVDDHGLDSFYSYRSFAVSFIFISLFFLGVLSVKKVDREIYILKERTITIFSREINLIFTIGLFLSLLSFASLFIYASQFGGMERAILAADAVRSGHGDEFWISKRFIFVYRFIPFSILAIIIFFLLESHKNFWAWLMLWMGFGVALFSRFTIFKSKQAIIELILLYLFYLSLKNKKSYMFHFVLFFLATIFIIPALESYLDTGKFVLLDSQNILQAVFDMLSFFNFDQTSLEFALNKEYDFVYFEGIISGMRGNLIPFSWMSSIDNNTIYTNTYFFYARRESIVPPGIIGFGYYNLGILGVILVAFFSGFLMKKVEYFFNSITLHSPKFIILYAYILTKVFTWVRTGIPKFTFYSTILIVLSLIILISYRHIEADSL
jgi:oligosaccharide repeat unit polymerase